MRVRYVLFTVAAAVVLAASARPAGSSCQFQSGTLDGVVLNHVRDDPYPFQSTCELWISKVVIQVVEYEEDYGWVTYKYKGYITPSSVCTFNGVPGNCADIKRDDILHTGFRFKPASPLRGSLTTVEVERS